MPRYRYQATDAHGRRRAGEIDADGPEQIARHLEVEGLRVERFEAAEPDGEAAEVVPRAEPEDAAARDGRRLSGREVADFTRHLADLTASGLALPSGLRALAEESPRDPLRRVLLDVADRLEEGSPWTRPSRGRAGASPRTCGAWSWPGCGPAGWGRPWANTSATSRSAPTCGGGCG
jgi:type II secretory pathway component PulF